MKIRGHGNGLAIALAGLAVVIAGSGTAYAVTATVVNIADPTTPTRVAKVDPLGRLTTIDPASTVNVAKIMYTNSSKSAEIYSAPTTATLAVTGFTVTALGATSAKYSVFLFQVPVQADGTCSTTITTRPLGYGIVSPGSPADQDFAAPIVVAPISGASYCLDLYASSADATTAPVGEALGFQITAYATAGKYVPGPAGAADAPAAPQSKRAATGGR